MSVVNLIGACAIAASCFAQSAGARGAEIQAVTFASDGVYTSDQAQRGRLVVQSHCISCHGDTLSGSEAPALVGSSFMLKWERQSLERLLRKIRETMPADDPGAVREIDKLDVLAYLLQANGFASGATELPREPGALETVQMRNTEGERPRDGSMVEAVGCLARGPDNDWLLNSASPPRATAIETAKSAATAPLGSGIVRLMSVFPDPGSHEGHKMQAKGLLVGGPAGDRINVLSLELLAQSCER